MTFSATFDTGLHADCVKFVVADDAEEIKEEIALFSCYQLDETSNKRIGKLILAERQESQVQVLQTISGIPGVFDFSWLGKGLMVAALAEGPPKLFQYSEKLLTPLPFDNEATSSELKMTLAATGDSECIVSCDDKGILRQWSLDQGTMEVVHEWIGHDGEIWYVSRDLKDKNIFYSASDDYSFKGWDVRTAERIFTNRTGHLAGVCCVSGSPFEEFTIASGSYDEKVCLWDRRRMLEPLRSIECGSGAWRVVWSPTRRNELAVAAMRAGFHVLDLDAEVAVVQSELVDDHVAYGIDWHSSGNSLASCSFYNDQGQFFVNKVMRE